ncbi:MAG: hypothetical protein GX776_09410, partial [Oxalobacter sp.]|nr:hypothetical protein [Oxalobacter sp.]
MRRIKAAHAASRHHEGTESASLILADMPFTHYAGAGRTKMDMEMLHVNELFDSEEDILIGGGEIRWDALGENSDGALGSALINLPA